MAMAASPSLSNARAGAPSESSDRPFGWPLLLVAVVCLVGLGWQLRLSLNLADEGFLWYGAQRVLVGELPLRDFQAYDPGRYFWSAAWMRLLGDNGIVALRAGNVVLGTITVVLGTWTISSSSAHRSVAPILATGGIFTLWMVPTYKVSDSFAVILLMFALTRLVRRPTLSRYFEAGICWGVAATIGINHALYGAVAGFLTFLYLRGAPKPTPVVIAGFAGALLGYSPVLALHAAAPGFTGAFIDSIRRLFEYGETNQALPFPSLLAFLQGPQMGYLIATTETVGALLFLGVPILWLWMGWRLRRRDFRAEVPPVIPAALILSLPYAHYAYSRADPLHVAVSILPVIATILAWAMLARPGLRRLVFGLIFGISLIFTAHMHAGYSYLHGYLTESVSVASDRLLVAPVTAADVRAVQKVAKAAGPHPFFAGPYVPGAYAVAQRKAPVWEIYMLFPALPARQQAEIERIRSASVRYALLSEERADERSDLGLAQTHPLLHAHLRRCLPKIDSLPTEPRFIILSAAGAPCPYR